MPTDRVADNRKTVLIIESMSKAGRSLLDARTDLRVVTFPISVTRAEFLEILKREPRVDAMVLGAQRIGADEFAAARNLAVIARIGVGYDAIDIPAATKAKVPIMTTGIANSPSVAEKALYFMLTLAKRGPHMDAVVRENRWWDRLSQMPGDLGGKTVLVVGFGRIGSRTVRRCLAFEMTVLVHDPHVDAATIKAAGAEPVASLDAALPRADFVSLHCPKSAVTTGLIGAKQLAAMKPSAFVINTARGGIVDEAALAAALRSNTIAGAGLDVLAEEPPMGDNPLFKFPNVIFAPHMAGVTTEAAARMAAQAALNLLSVFDGQILADNVVNREVIGGS
jgi:D-3-phosphoglycerate dehydrogenase / 2-oxoglutarate reductase